MVEQFVEFFRKNEERAASFISAIMHKQRKRSEPNACKYLIKMWAQLGTIQRPPDYESGALTS